MPSVGSLLLSIRADTDQLRKDLDAAKGKIAEFGNATKGEGEKAAKSMDALGLSVDRVFAAKAAAGMHLLAGAVKSFGGESGKEIGKFIDGGARVAAAYAVNGPIGGAIVGLTELVAGLAEAERAAAEKRAKILRESREAAEGLRSAYEKVGLAAELSGETEIQTLTRTVKELREKKELLGGGADNPLANGADISREQARRHEEIIRLEKEGTEAARARVKVLAEEEKQLGGLRRAWAEVVGAQARLREAQRSDAVFIAAGRPGLATQADRAQRVLDKAQADFEQAAIPWRQFLIEAAKSVGIELDAAAEKLRRIKADRDFDISQIIRDSDRRARSLRAGLLDAPTEFVDAEQKIEALEERIAFLRQRGDAAAKEEIQTLRTKLEVSRDDLDVLREVTRLKADRDIGRQIDSIFAITDAQRRELDISNAIREWTKRGASQGMIDGLVAAMRAKPWLEAAHGMAQDFGSALSDSLYDVIVNRGKNTAEIFADFVHSALKKALDSVFSQGMDLLFNSLGGLLGGGRGGGGGGLGSILSVGLGLATGGGGGGGAGAIAPILGGAADCPT